MEEDLTMPQYSLSNYRDIFWWLDILIEEAVYILAVF